MVKDDRSRLNIIEATFFVTETAFPRNPLVLRYIGLSPVLLSDAPERGFRGSKIL